MLKLVSDENFNGDILRGLFRRSSDLDIVRVQDVELSATPTRTFSLGRPSRGEFCLLTTVTPCRISPTTECVPESRCPACSWLAISCRSVKPSTKSGSLSSAFCPRNARISSDSFHCERLKPAMSLPVTSLGFSVPIPAPRMMHEGVFAREVHVGDELISMLRITATQAEDENKEGEENE